MQNLIQNPYPLFDQWMAEARASEVNDSNAVALATADANGRPSVRMVLLKGHGADLSPTGGFIFYTNTLSRKGHELAANQAVALLFHWKSSRRQVRIEGRASPVDSATADAYFATRARESQLGAHASLQSQALDGRATFEAHYAEAETRFAGRDVPRPAHWSGYLVTPDAIEFWQDREFRLHERYRLTPDETAPHGWAAQMLYP
jgi:pyridoxamine 5'-phosphate oxidase